MSDNQGVKLEKKFSLIDLLMIVMLVGIVFSFIIPLREDSRNNEMVREAIRDMRIIIRANAEFRQENDYWAFDLGMLNIGDKLEQNYFNYTLSDTTITAVSTENFAVKDARFHYFLPNGPWIVDDDRDTRRFIDPHWLP